MRSGRSWRTIVYPNVKSTRNSTAPPQATRSSPLGTGAPTMDPSRATIGRQNSTPLEMMALAVSAAPAEPRSIPDTESMRNPVAPPTAAPPGSTFATAFDTSCAVPATNQVTWGSATRVSAQAQT